MKNSLFICPNCGRALSETERSFVCQSGHVFDRAKSGYVNLYIKKSSERTGDSKESIAARERIMSLGYYEPLARVLENYVSDGDAVLDVCSGEGWLDRALCAKKNGVTLYGVDLSKNGVDFAAKRLKSARYAVANASELPFADGTFDVVFCVFAPVFIKEYARVLKKGGRLVIVTPAEKHLFRLKRELYDEPYLNERQTFGQEGCETVSDETVCSDFTVVGDDVAKLIAMTPYAYKTAPDRLKKVAVLPSVTVEREFAISVLVKKY